MELYQTNTRAEKILQQKADAARIPLGGTIELLPLCNMDCKMCYVRKSKKEMDAEGRMLTCDEWLRIADEAIAEGLLFLLLTGGEPLLYPDFKRLYADLAAKGVILSLNTNGTLIDEEWADFFAEHGCRRVNITLYGKDNDTYGKLCNNPRGFSQVMRACRLLKERDVAFRLNCSVTPDNAEQMAEFFTIANQFEVPLSTSTYMFPGSRRGVTAENQYRLTPEQSAAKTIECHRLEYPEDDMVEVAKNTLRKLYEPAKLYKGNGFNCHAARSGFWLTWKGEMTPCGMFEEPKISLQEYSFRECWDYIVKESEKMTICSDCKKCSLQNMCRICLAKCYTESGSVTGRPEHICQITRSEFQLLKDIVFSEKVHQT